METSEREVEQNRDLSVQGQVLSDVHVHATGHAVHIDHGDFSESRFCFKPPWSFMRDTGDSALKSRWRFDDQDSSASTGTAKELATNSAGEGAATVVDPGTNQLQDACKTDEDGDLIVSRKHAHKDSMEQVITIVHAMGTDLSLVGQQVWLGALLLCDFVLHYSGLLEGQVVVDLGAGVGLTSIVAACRAATVFCTDRGDDVLSLAQRNVEQNGCLRENADIRVRQLDWTAETPIPDCADASDLPKTYCLSKDDVEMFRTCSIILAAEVVYDLDLTDAFFSVLYSLMKDPPAKSAYMTVEKRQVFTTADREVVSPAYEHFRENLQDLSSVDEGPVRFLCSQVDLSFPHYFHYQRTKELELWKIEAVFVHRSNMNSHS